MQVIRHSAKNNSPVSSDQGTECTVSVYPQDISGGLISYRAPKEKDGASAGLADSSFPLCKTLIVIHKSVTF
jgi:hypothetical protein